MKKALSIFIIFFFVFGVIFNQSCSKDICEEKMTYIKYVPVYLSVEDLRDVKVEGPREMNNPGKIYVYNNYLFVNELYEGIHIIDNSDITNPIPISFLSIRGNIDMAVRNGFLYADNIIDLLIFDIRNPSIPSYIGMQAGIFNKKPKSNSNNIYLIRYLETNETIEVDCSNSEFGQAEIWLDNDDLLWDSQFDSNGSKSNKSNPNGTGGSFARFSLVDDRLYIIDNFNLNIYDVSETTSPILLNSIRLGSGIETIFPNKDKLFIGSTSGMYIYDNKNRDLPVLISIFDHARACDPVYVKGDVAYVTLRDGTRCRGFVNQLDVIDIRNLSQPKLIKTYEMKNPHGLSIIDDKMILCEGQFGLKVIDINDNRSLRTVSEITNNHFYDVIGINKDHIILTGNDGLFQYELKGKELNKVSSIFVK